MNLNPATYLTMVFIFIIVSSESLSAQHTVVDRNLPGVIKKDVAFIVRKPDKAKNIALRFHVPFKLLSRLNMPLRKKQVMYAGKKLVIPVWLQRKDNGNATSDFNMTNYTVDIDSLDSYISEDFVSLADIGADSFRKIAIGKEMRKIDRRIDAVNLLMDSIEEVGMRNLSNRDIRKMPMERARRAGNFKIGVEIDSLRSQKERLAIERTKIDIRQEDYEYLIENAPYMASHTDLDNSKTINIQEWGDDPDKTKTGKGKNKK